MSKKDKFKGNSDKGRMNTNGQNLDAATAQEAETMAAVAAMEAEKIAEEAAKEAEAAAEEKAGDDGISKEEQKIRELEDKVVRQMAEFDNFRKRTEKEKSAMYDMGAKAIIEKLLPVIDNFERGLENAPDDAFAEGIMMIYKQLVKNLNDAGVEAIDCVGKEFDPNFHNAVMHEEDDSKEENIVTAELQKGYTYKGELVRPSMVKVKN